MGAKPRLSLLLLCLFLLLCSGCGSSGTPSGSSSACLLAGTGTIEQLGGLHLSILDQQHQQQHASFSSSPTILHEQQTTRAGLQSFVGKKIEVLLSSSTLSSPAAQVIGVQPAAQTAANTALNNVLREGYARCADQTTIQLWPGNTVAGTLVQLGKNSLTMSDQSGLSTTIAFKATTRFLTSETGTIANVQAGAQIQFFGLRDQRGNVSVFFLQVLA